MDAKDVEVKARVSAATRKQLEEIAGKKKETLSLVVREALNEYLERRCQLDQQYSNWVSGKTPVSYSGGKKVKKKAQK